MSVLYPSDFIAAWAAKLRDASNQAYSGGFDGRRELPVWFIAHGCIPVRPGNVGVGGGSRGGSGLSRSAERALPALGGEGSRVSAPVSLRLRLADVGTPEALLRSLGAIGCEVVLRRDEDGLGLGFAAPGVREMRLDALLGSCGIHDGDWWLDAVGELWFMFPDRGSPWAMRVGEVRRLRPAGATGLNGAQTRSVRGLA